MWFPHCIVSFETADRNHELQSAMNQMDFAGGPAVNAALIINADDWGLDRNVTDRTLECLLQGVASSVSAMVFMEDSERAAVLAQQHGVNAGLHLNLTTPFTAFHCPPRLQEHQRKLIRVLRTRGLSLAIYHPGLVGSFEYVVSAQLAEYERLYHMPAKRVDGHHHMHLCANVLSQKLLPAGTIVRRNFSFGPEEKSAFNRWYRRWRDKQLARRHSMTDYFFALPPMDLPGRLERIFALATRFRVEVETHPADPDEYAFLMNGELMRHTGSTGIARGYSLG